MSLKKTLAIAIPVVALISLGAVLLSARSGKPAVSGGYAFSTVERGSIESVVSATGTLEPVSTVSVLARMSGRAEKVYADYNDHVKKDQVLVALDTATLELQRKEAVASVTKATANRDLAQLEYDKDVKLAAKGLLADSDLATARTSLEVAQAELVSAEASLEIIDTELSSYALVRSPIEGIVLERSVDVGQSVVEGSSSNSSSLFTLAEDLAHMEIEAEVDELDIGGISVGQSVRFSVEAAPGKTFSGVVRQVRLVPTTTDNVVSYTVIVDADNAEGSLLPGMTASLEFIKESKENILTVPNAALRFSPPSLSEAEKAKKLFVAGLPSSLSSEERGAALARYDEAVKAAAEAKAKGESTKSTGGLAGMVMPGGGGGMGGPPPMGGEGGVRRANSSSSRTRQGTNGSSTTGSEPGPGPDALPPGEPGSVGGATKVAAAPAERKALWYLDDAGELQALLVSVGFTDGTKTEVSGAEGLEGMRVITKVKTE